MSKASLTILAHSWNLLETQAPEPFATNGCPSSYKGGKKSIMVYIVLRLFTHRVNPTHIMPSPVLHPDAAAGIATITAIAALGNSRPLPGTKTVILDAQIYVDSPTCESLMGSLRFFNASGMKFEHKSALYLIYATVCALFQSPEHFESSILTLS